MILNTFNIILWSATLVLLMLWTWRVLEFNRARQREINQLLDHDPAEFPERPTIHSVPDLPAPVQRYLRYALPLTLPHVFYVSLKQEGFIRFKTNQKWTSLVAEQYYSLIDPAFVWIGRIPYWKLFWISARDMYFRGEGGMYISFLSTIPLANLHGYEMDISSLCRFLCETPMFPTFLIPSSFITWEDVDDHHATVHLHHHNMKVSALCTFNDRGEMTQMETHDRYREEKGRFKKTKWVCHYSNYHEVEGFKLPRKASAEWHLPEGPFEYIQIAASQIQFHSPDALSD